MHKDYQFFRTLEEFEGTILDEWHSDKGVFVRKWCDHNTWVLCKTTKARIEAYLSFKISLYDLMFEFNKTVLIYNDKENSIKEEKVSNLPEKGYLPDKTAMHDESLYPKGDSCD